jgi:hypothetical protein
MQRQAPAPQKVPLPLEPTGPVAQTLDLIEEQDGLSASRSILSFTPATFPEAGKCSIGFVPGRIYSSLAELSRDLEK